MKLSQEFINLEGQNWVEISQKIYTILKIDLQGSNGLIKKLKQNLDKTNINLFYQKASDIKKMSNFSLDTEINNIADIVLESKKLFINELCFNFLNSLGNLNLSKFTAVSQAYDFLMQDNHQISRDRLLLILSKLINESIVNSNKNDAGRVIQEIVKFIFTVAGLRFGIDYRDKYRSQNSAEVNFVLPSVPDNEDIKVEIALACQMSSNDRVKLAINELNIGNKKFLLTGNGLMASNISLQKISSPIINELKEKKIMLICYDKGLEKEINRISELGYKNNARLDYFKNFSITFHQFYNYLKTTRN